MFSILRKILKSIVDFFCHKPPSGSGSGNFSKKGTIKLTRKTKDVIGQGQHRTGWPWVYQNLSLIHSDDGVLFDDFFEQNFCYRDNPTTYKEPWATIIHHPHEMPIFGNYTEELEVAFKTQEFIDSEPYLKVVFALSDHLADWLRTQLKCKVVSLKHPFPYEQITKHWEGGDKKTVYQLGYYLRNTDLCNQIKLNKPFKIKRLWNDVQWLNNYNEKVKLFWLNTERDRNSVDVVSEKFAMPSKYDRILQSNVIIAEYFACSASNVILECISYNTPIIVNRLPSLEQYLGKDYPLFYDDIYKIPDLLKKADEGNRYLMNMDKSDLRINLFLDKIKEEVSLI